MSTRTGPNRLILYSCLLPTFALTIFTAIIPLVLAFYYSFFDWMGGPMKPVGLLNYINLLNDSIFWQSLKNNIIIVGMCSVGHLVPAFILAVLLSGRWMKLRAVYRFCIFLPVVLSPIVVGFIWRMIYNSKYGLLNAALKALGLQELIYPYLDRPETVILFATFPIVWQYIGLYMVIFLASIQGIPEDILNVAELDGASNLQRARHIVFPLTYETIKVAILLSISGNMKVFDHIYSLTSGGPGNASTVLAMYAYKSTFTMMKVSYGSAISISTLVISLMIILLSRVLMRKNYSEN